MIEPLSLPVDLIEEIERRAAAHGRTPDQEAGRLMAKGLLLVLADRLAPLLDEPEDSEGAGADAPAPLGHLSLPDDLQAPPSLTAGTSAGVPTRDDAGRAS